MGRKIVVQCLWEDEGQARRKEVVMGAVMVGKDNAMWHVAWLGDEDFGGRGGSVAVAVRSTRGISSGVYNSCLTRVR